METEETNSALRSDADERNVRGVSDRPTNRGNFEPVPDALAGGNSGGVHQVTREQTGCANSDHDGG